MDHSISRELARVTDSAAVQQYCQAHGCAVRIKAYAKMYVFTFSKQTRVFESAHDMIAFAHEEV